MVILTVGSITAEVTQKDIQNIHLSVYPPEGAVRVSAPLYMTMDTIRVYISSKLAWIKQQQRKFNAQPRETPRSYIQQESHYMWGQRYLLTVIEHQAPPCMRYDTHHFILKIRATTTTAQRDAFMSRWYRQQLREQAEIYIQKWLKVLNIQQFKTLYICKMKTRWGSCSPSRGNIRLNTELAKKPKECLEYIVLHELLHFIDGTHGDVFQSLLHEHLPNWRMIRQSLNALPIHD